MRFITCFVIFVIVAPIRSPILGQMEHDPYVDSKNDGIGYEGIPVEGVYRNFAPIHIAAARGDVVRLAQELAEGVPADLRVVNRGGSSTWRDTTPLIWAAMMGHAHCVQTLLDVGADANAIASNGLTPLLAAAGAVPTIDGDELACVNALLAAGADVNATDDNGNSALAYACGVPGSIESPPERRIKPELVDHRPTKGDLIRPGVGGSIGFNIERRSPRVVMNGDVPRMQALLKAGADVNRRGEGGGSLLSSAVHYTDASRLQILLDHGADVRESRGGWNALMVAAAYGDWPCFKLLLNAGADIHTIDRINGNQTVLIWAIRGGEDAGKKVRALVEAGADIRAKSDCTETLLLLAASHPFGESVEVLLNAGLDPTERDQQGRSALMLAAGHCDAVGLKALLQTANFDVAEQSPPPESATALHLAARSETDSAAKVSVLLEAGCAADALDGSGMSPLLLAAQAGNMHAVEMLANAGADVSRTVPPNAKGWSVQPGMSAIHLVAHRGGDDTFMSEATGEGAARSLISRGADVNLKDEQGRTPLLLALQCLNFGVAELLLASGADASITQHHQETFDDFTFVHRSSPLCAAITANATVALIESIVKHGADARHACSGGQTPLHLACQRMNLEVMELLVRNGADVNARDEMGQSPLMSLLSNSWDFRLRRGRQDKEPQVQPSAVLEWLFKHGADLELQDKTGKTPLMHAITGRENSAVQALLEHHVRVDAVDHEGATALMWAALYHDLDGVRALIQAGAAVNAQNNVGETPLMYAAKSYKAGACRLLVELGADHNAKNARGFTALDIARAEGRNVPGEDQSPAQYLASLAEPPKN